MRWSQRLDRQRSQRWTTHARIATVQSMRWDWRPWFDAALDLALPAVCPACNSTPGADICSTCLAECPVISDPCPACGAPREPATVSCDHCHGHGLDGIAGVHVDYHYLAVIERLVTTAKANGSPAAVRCLAELAPAPPQADEVIPMPANPGRRQGPHLATAIARRAAQRGQLPLRKRLALRHQAAAQHALTKADRLRNVTELFRVRGTPGRHVVLVDDLITTGTTLIAAAKALRAAGAKQVTALCVARTPKRGERPRPAPASAGGGPDAAA